MQQINFVSESVLLNIDLEFFSSKHVNFNHFSGHVYQ